MENHNESKIIVEPHYWVIFRATGLGDLNSKVTVSAD